MRKCFASSYQNGLCGCNYQLGILFVWVNPIEVVIDVIMEVPEKL